MPVFPALPRLRHLLAATLPLCLLLAACGRTAPSAPLQAQPRQDALPPAATRGAPSSRADAPPTPAPGADAAADGRWASDAAGTVHAYLQALASGRTAQADAMWANGMPGSRSDDALLRDIQRFDALGIDNDAPVALDRDLPPHAVEIPVRLRYSRDGRVRRIAGGYRLRRAIDGRHWEITGAALRPALD